MSVAPRYNPVIIIDDPGTGFGSLLSILSLGLIKDPPKPVVLTRTEIQQQMALAVANQMAQNCQSADNDKIVASVGYNIDSFGAWAQVLSDSNVVQEVVNKTISDLLASNLVTVAPGCSNAGAPVAVTGKAVLPAGATPAPLTLTPAMLGIGAAGLLGLLLLTGGHRGAVRR